MSAANSRYHTCPACQLRLSVKTSMRKHLFNYCSVTHQLKEDIENGLLSKRAVTRKINEYVSIWKDCRSKKICACQLLGTNFCQRIVSLIDWKSDITQYTILNGKTKSCYVRYAIWFCRQIFIVLVDLNF